MAADAPEPRPSVRFGPYVAVREIGRGGMGRVCEVVHEKLDKRFALKTLLHPPDEDTRRRFLREALATAAVRHPNVIDVTDVGEAEGLPYLVMEFLQGQTLEELLAKRGRLPVPELAGIALAVVSALRAAHARKLIHRDLKPSNIFLARDATGRTVPKVIDFGIVKDLVSVEARTATKVILGTPHYMSPEQIRTPRGIDDRTDQFSLGVILYQCATGTVPFTGDEVFAVLQSVLQGAYAPLRERASDAPEAFAAVVERLLSNDRRARFDDVHALGCALFPFASLDAQVHWRDEFGARSAATKTSRLSTAADDPDGMRSNPDLPEKDARTSETSPRDRSPDAGWPRLLVVAALSLATGSLAVHAWSRRPPSTTRPVAPVTPVAVITAPAPPVAAALPATPSTPAPALAEVPRRGHPRRPRDPSPTTQRDSGTTVIHTPIGPPTSPDASSLTPQPAGPAPATFRTIRGGLYAVPSSEDASRR